VYYSDEEAKRLLDGDKTIKEFLVKEFGEEVISSNGKVDRKKIADKVFGNKALLEKLNAVVHPAVGAHFENWSKGQNAPYVLKEAAILFESGADRQVDLVITVLAPMELKVSRAMKRGGLSREEVLSRMNNQMSDEEKAKRSTYTLLNNEIDLLIPQVLAIHSELTK
jgi:dephospho-CoA kinase